MQRPTAKYYGNLEELLRRRRGRIVGAREVRVTRRTGLRDGLTDIEEVIMESALVYDKLSLYMS